MQKSVANDVKYPRAGNSFGRYEFGRWWAVLAAICAIYPASKTLGAETSDPVLSLMLEKGMITESEAVKVQAQVDARRTNPAAQFPESKWKISAGLKSVELFGDLRLRYESRSAKDPNHGSIDLNRLRYAVRLGLRGELFDDYYYGFRMETSPNPRSAWNTFGKSSDGPFSKSTSGISISQVYLGWKPENWADITVGKMPNPLYTTPMVWDPDLNPEGLAERFKVTVGEADFFANFGQFLYQDTNPTKASRGYFNSLNVNSSNLPFLLAWQAGMNYHLAEKVSLKIAPALYQYLNFGSHSPSTSYAPDFAGTYVGQGTSVGVNGYPASYNLNSPGFDGFAANQTGVNNLMVLDIPFELNVKLKKVDLRLFGDYAQNLEGGKRATAAYNTANSSYVTQSGLGGYTLDPISSPQTHDKVAYQVGLAVGSPDSLGLVNGSTYKKRSWEFRTYWQHIEQYALDPNLMDSDVFEGRGNLQGINAQVAYALTDNLIGAFRYSRATRINNKLGTGGSNADLMQMNPIKEFDLFQFDLIFKF
jgi:hypothetical protein